jgi:NAD-dependent histone deacetylase SIR2
MSELNDADLLIVIGTSLTVHPFAALVDTVGKQCPRVLINLDKVGDIGSRKNDLVLLGKCDDILRDLAKELGWEDELDREWAGTAASLDGYEATQNTPTKEKGKTDEAKVDLELQKIVDRVEGALSISEKDKPADVSTRAARETREDVKGKGTATASQKTGSGEGKTKC